MFWEHWGGERAGTQEHMAFITGGRAGDLRVRPGSVISSMSLRISESQFPQLQYGDGVLLARTCCRSKRSWWKST